MTEKKAKSISLIYGICLSVLSLVVAALFIVQIWSIFRSAEKAPYTTEIVSEKFSKIALPFWLWIAAIVGGGVLSLAFPEAEQKPKAMVDVKKTLTRLKGRLPENSEGMVEVNKESLLRKVMWGTCTLVCMASIVVGLVYLLNADYVAKFQTEFYQSHTEAEKLIKIFPFIFASLCVCAGASIYHTYSLRKELNVVKRLVAESAKRGEKPAVKEEKESLFQKWTAKLSFLKTKKAMMIVRIVLGTAAVALFVVGIFNGGMSDVFRKAVNICTQCIGLG